MNNFVLFICGSVISLVSGMGVLIYMVSVGYRKKKPIEVDTDLGAVEAPEVKKSPMDSFVEIPSVS